MPRATNHVAKNRRKKRILSRVKGFRAGRSKLLRTAREVGFRSDVYATKHRRKKKGDWRRLWILRINAACRARGIRYGEFMNALKKANIALDRKVLADLAVRDVATFDSLVSRARSI